MKQFELGACDLLSLEPVDDNNRPFRLKNYVRDEKMQNYNDNNEAE